MGVMAGRPVNYRYWDSMELDVLRALYRGASRPRLMRALPGRSWSRIKQKARELGLTRPRVYDVTRFWARPVNKERLAALYPAAPWSVLLSAFPGQSRCVIGNVARKLGYRRLVAAAMAGRNKVRDPVVAALVMRRGELDLRQEDVAKKLELSRSYFAACERGDGNYTRDTLRRWCMVLGMEAVVRVKVSALARSAAVDMEKYERSKAA